MWARLLPAIVLAIGFMVFALVDVGLIEKDRVRGLPKWGWMLLIVLVPIVGAVLWLAVGRVRLGDAGSGRARRLAPDDDPEFLRRVQRERAMEDRIAELERELRDLDDDPPRT